MGNNPKLGYDNNYFCFILTRVYHLDTWLGPYPGSTTKSGVKTMIITFFVFTLTWINDQPRYWLGPYLKSTPKLDFKTLIITSSFFTLTRVNLIYGLGLDHWPKLCPGSAPKLNFKIIIITIFIIICLSWIIL